MNLNVWILIFYSINSVLANITESIVNVDSYKFYENEDGTVDKQRTVLYLHFVNPEDNSIMEVDSVLSLIDKNHKFLNELYQEFHVLLGEVRISHFSYFNHSLNSLFLWNFIAFGRWRRVLITWRTSKSGSCWLDRFLNATPSVSHVFVSKSTKSIQTAVESRDYDGLWTERHTVVESQCSQYEHPCWRRLESHLDDRLWQYVVRQGRRAVESYFVG